MSNFPRLFYLAVFIGGFTVYGSAPGGEKIKPHIAVFPCKTGEGVTITEGSFISDRITLEIIKQGRYTVSDKYEIKKKLGLSDEFQDTCSSYSCYFTIGQKCGARLALWTALSRRDTAMVLALHCGDVAEKRVLNSVSTSIVGSTLELADQLPSLLAELFILPVLTAGGNAPASGARPQTVYTPQAAQSPLTLSVRSEPAGAKVVLNGEEIGATPCSKDSLFDGTYDIVFDLYGYKKFSTRIILKPNVDKRVFAQLERAFGALTVITSPSNASCSVGGGLCGVTPFFCDTVRPGAYSIKLSLDQYATVMKTIQVSAGRWDTVRQTLVPLRYLDSLKQAHRKKMQFARKVVFGAASACCLGLGLASEYSARKSLEKQHSAYAEYRALNGNSSVEEFDAKYSEYQNNKTETDKSLRRRNIEYGLSAVFLVGVAVSFRF